MSLLTLDRDDLDPTLYQMGLLAGLFQDSAGDQIAFQEDWFSKPGHYLGNAVAQRPEALLALLASLLGSSDPQVLGLPTGTGDGETWYPINGPDGNSTGLYLVTRQDGTYVHFGIGVRWSTAVDPLNISIWAHVPLVKTNGTSGGTSFVLGQGSSYETGSPVQMAVEITSSDRFGTAELGFSGVKLAGQVLFSQVPQVSFVFLDLQLPDGQPASDRSLADLTNIEAREWIEMAISLFVAQLTETADSTVQLIRDNLLPILGLSGSVPSIHWEELPARGLTVFQEWLLALVDNETHLTTWLNHWLNLLSAEALDTALPFVGSGTRPDPYRIGVRFNAGNISLFFTMAAVANDDGSRTLYPGIWLQAPTVTISGTIQLAFEAVMEIAAINLTNPPGGEPLPAFDVRMRLFDSAGSLVNHDFTGHADLDPLGQFNLDEIRVGLTLDADHRPAPMIHLVNLQCLRGSWPVLDLSAAEAALDGFSSAVGSFIQEQLENALGGSGSGEHAGRHVAALLGLLPPTDPTAPATWPVPLAVDTVNLTAFLGDPLLAVGCYHAVCLEQQIGGAPAWRFLLSDIVALLRHGSVPAPALSGVGTPASPWALPLYDDSEGTATLQAWTTTSSGRPQLFVGFDLEPTAVSLGGGVNFTLHQQTQVLHLDLPLVSNCPGPVTVTWLPEVLIEGKVAGSSPITLSRLAGLQLSLTSVAVSAQWNHQDGFSWLVKIENPGADWSADSLTLPDLQFGTHFPLAWDLSLPDFGLGLSVDPLHDLFRFVIGIGLLERGGPFGFSLAGLLGLLPNLPNFSFPNLPAWDTGPFKLPLDWPTFDPPSWPAFFANPWPDIRLHLGKLLANPTWAWPTLQWLGGLFHLSLPDMALPDLGWPSLGDGSSGLSFPTLPFTITGSGTYEDPWAITLHQDGDQQWQQLTWLDPDGPPSGSAVDVILSFLPAGLQSLSDLIGDDTFTYDQLLLILDKLATVDTALHEALEAVVPANMAAGLNDLEQFLSGSDGAIISVSQQPVAPTDASPGDPPWAWNDPTPLANMPEAHHWAQLAHADITSAIKTKVDEWSGMNDLPVLLLNAPWEEASAWTAVLTQFGSPSAAHFDLMEFGTDPAQISLETVTGNGRFYTADLAIFNTAPGTPPAERPLPVAGSGSSQAGQLSRLVDRIRELHPGKQVIIVAHSTAGLAARAAITTHGDASRTRGLITIGTPHVASPLPWQAVAGVREALALIARLNPNDIPNETLKTTVQKLLEFVNGPSEGSSADTLPLAPSHIFTPAGPLNLPVGVDGHALASRLPLVSLRDQFLAWLEVRLTTLRAALDGRSAPTHIGFGLRTRLAVATDAGVQVRTDARIDIARIPLGADADDSGYLTLPRLTLRNLITRQDGWLVGGVGQNPRLRWAELGLTLAPGTIEPAVRLYDAHLNGVSQLQANLEKLADDTFELPVFMRRLLDEMMRALTREAESVPAFNRLSQLLKDVGLALDEGSGFALNPSGWDSFLADPAGYLSGQLSNLLADAARRTAFFNRVRDYLGLDGAGIGCILAAQDSDTAAMTCLREVLAQLGLLHPASQGYAINFAAWLDLVQEPIPTLRALATALHNDESHRVALINHLRTCFGLDDASNSSVQNPLGDHFSLDVTSAGQVSLCITADDALTLGAALRLYGCITLNLAARSLEVSAKVRPVHINAAVAAVYDLRLSAPINDSWRIQLHLGEGALPAPYDPLDLFPLPPDFVTRLGEMLPRYLVATFAARLLESQLLANVSAAGPMLACLGLAYRRNSSANWQIRPFDGLFVQPVTWLLSEPVLGTADGQLDSTKALCIIDNARDMLGLTGSPGTIPLPFGLHLTASAAAGFRVGLETAAPLALPNGGSLGLTCAFTIAANARVGVGGQVDLRFDLPDIPSAPDMWDQVVVQAGYADDSFSLKLGTDTALIALLPFGGWDAVLLQLAATARKLLPTMVEAAIEALQDGASPDLSDFLTDLLNAASALQVDSAAGMKTLVNNPVGWLQDRFSAANAAASATAVFNLFDGRLNGISNSGSGHLTYQPGGSPIAIKIGRDSFIGAWVTVTDLATGPLRTGFSAHVDIDDTVTPPVQFGVALETAVAPNIINPGGISIESSLHFAYDGSLDLHLYPLGDQPGSPDFRLDILPSFQFFCEGGSDMTDCLLEFARRILVPLTVEMFLDNGDVTGWLNTDLVSGASATRPGTILINVGLLLDDGSGGFNLQVLDSLPTPEQTITRLLGEGLSALQAALGTTALVPLGDPPNQGGIFLAHKTDDTANLYGIRLLIPDVTISNDPEIKLELGGDVAWINSAGVPDSLEGGVSLFLLRQDGDDYSFQMDLDVVSVGVDFSGKNDDPLLDSGGFRLGGVDTRLYLSLQNVTSSASIDFGAYARVNDVGIPLGAGNGNPVAQSLLSSDSGTGGESESVNPAFSVAVAYVNELHVDLEGQQPNEAWFPIQRAFGPVHIDQIGVRWQQEGYKLSILVDGGVTIEGLAVGVDDLSLTIPIKTALDLSTWSLGLRGLAIAYSGGGVRITGALRQVGEGNHIRYDGLCLVEVSGRTFTAIGSYMKDPFTSLFVFVLLPITIGGPPYLFIIGLAGGFGYNRGLLVPDVGDVPDFPLIAAARGDSSFSEDPMSALIALGDDVPPKRGSYWIAAGIRFTSFELVESVALVYVLLDRGLEIGLLGVSQMELPEGKPLVNIEMALKARFSTVEGVLSIEARLTDNSWLLSRDCRLTGGFAFYLWFGGPYQGDFVVTMGGYHPRFKKPTHYPDVPRLGFNWRVSSTITIKGESYFALTPSCVMAGGLLEASYKSGNLKAWFTAYAHFLISWRPFGYDIEIGISIGVSYRLRINLLFGTITKTFKVELGARVWIWGPELSGEVEVTWWVISFTFSFGANANITSKNKIPWDEFRTQFLPSDEEILAGFVEKGLLEEEENGSSERWLLKPEFMLRVETVLATNRMLIGGKLETTTHVVDVRPMHENDIDSILTISIKKDGSTTEQADDLNARILSGQVPAALWDYDDKDDEPAAKTVPAWVGAQLVADIREDLLDKTGELQVKKIFEFGIYPLPFTQEIEARPIVVSDAAVANLLEQVAVFDSEQVLQASKAILSTGDWQVRRETALTQLGGLGFTAPASVNMNVTRAYLNRRRTAPPQIASLYEGMAAETVTDVPVTPVVVEPPIEVIPKRRIPQLEAILRQRPEPTKTVNRAVRTTVIGVTNGAKLPRFQVGQLTKSRVVGATLQRIKPPQANRATAVATRGTAFINNSFATPTQKMEFAALEEQAILSAPGVSLANFNLEAADEQSGIVLQAGMAQVWTLPSRNAVGEMPILNFAGDQAVRVTCLNRGNSFLADVEMVGSGQFQPPEHTVRIVVTGLGRPSSTKQAASGMGVITLTEASNPIPVVGWQGSTELTQVGRSTLLGRGAVLKMGAPLNTRHQSRRVDQSFLKAADAMKGQSGVETCLPPAATTVGILIERRDETADESLARGLGLVVQGATLSSEPISVLGGVRALLLYDVLSVDDEAPCITVGVAARLGWRVDGVLGMKNNALHWARALANESLTTLVENGPLTPQGQTRVAFSIR
ncbi:MAG: hypothetical protein GY803_09995 [Chloroflexi bacterium]|nr:hypothetical protein [Chloroflexota bacterium]